MSRQKAINAKCKDCIYDPKSGLGTWRQQVAGCTCTDCPLYPYRPLPDRRDRTGEPGGARKTPAAEVK